MSRLLTAPAPLVALLLTAAAAQGEDHRPKPKHTLPVHLAQANNDSPYTFVRARFEPGEVADPWAVRFFDPRGKEVPYFVWDSVTWKVAREGREDWGKRYALVNHHPGDAPEALQMRPRRLEAAKEQLPELGKVLAAQDEAARRSGDSVCVALYLLRHPVPAFGKDRLTLRIYPTRQTEPRRRTVAVREMPRQPKEVHEPLWEKPWWLHQLGNSGIRETLVRREGFAMADEGGIRFRMTPPPDEQTQPSPPDEEVLGRRGASIAALLAGPALGAALGGVCCFGVGSLPLLDGGDDLPPGHARAYVAMGAWLVLVPVGAIGGGLIGLALGIWACVRWWTRRPPATDSAEP